MAQSPKEAQDRAEASFKHKQVQARESKKAMVEYEAAGQAMRDKTARLRGLRLAKEAADRQAELDKPPVAAKKKKR